MAMAIQMFRHQTRFPAPLQIGRDLRRLLGKPGYRFAAFC
jgi:hypothetical protein